MTPRNVLLVALTAALSAGAEIVTPATTGQGWARRRDLLRSGLDGGNLAGLLMCGHLSRLEDDEPDEWRHRADGTTGGGA